MVATQTPSDVRSRAEAAPLTGPAIAFVLAGAIWILGDIGEMIGFAGGRGAPGPMMLLDQLVFDVAIVSFVVALAWSAHRGLAGTSLLGRIGLIAAAICFIVILVATTLAMLGLPQLGPALVVVGPLRSIAELLAGVGILLGGTGRLPGRAIFLVYGIALLLPVIADHVLPNSGEGPGFIYEIGQALLWMIIGISLLRAAPDRSGRAWFVAAVVIGAVVLAGIAVPH